MVDEPGWSAKAYVTKGDPGGANGSLSRTRSAGCQVFRLRFFSQTYFGPRAKNQFQRPVTASMTFS
jgi:hypothetical protein